MVVARVLSPEQLGLFAAATVVLTFFGMLSEQGLSEAVVQREYISPEQLSAVFWLNLMVSVVLVLLVWLTAPAIAQWMKIPDLTPILRVSSLALPIAAATFGQMAMRRRTFGYRWIATTAMASTAVGSIVLLTLLFAGFGVWSLVAQSLTAALVTAALMWMRPGWSLTRRVDFQGVRPLMAYGGNRLGTYLLDFANTRYVELFLASTLGPAALAVYTVGLKLYQALLQMLSSTVMDVAHSGFSRLANDRPGLIAAYYKSISITATIAVPIFCMVAAVAPSLTVVLFGPKWHASAEVMRWMGLLGAVQVLQFYNGTVYNAIGRPGIGLQFMIAKVALTIGALAFVRDGSMTALLHAYIASQLATTPASFYLVRRLIGVSITELARLLWPMLTGSVLMVVVAVIVQSMLQAEGLSVYLVLIGSVAAGTIAYLALLELVAPHIVRSTLTLIFPKKAPASMPAASPADVATK
jgi:O-antigen/teichoic acid export membrane protein